MSMSAQRIDELALDREIASRGLYHFVELAFPYVEPSVTFLPNWHIEAVCDHLEAFRRRDIKNLVINIPPGAMKSLLCCVMYPAHAWIADPGRRMIYGSYSDDVAKRDSLKTRQLVESPWYQDRWGAQALEPHDTVVPDPGQWEARRFSTKKGGMRYAVTVAGKVTGFHAHDQFVDDPTKPDPLEVRQLAFLEAKGWWNGIMSTRALPGCGRCIIMQRLSEDDLAGVALETGDYESLVIPMEHDISRVRCHTSLEFKDPRTEDGEHLWPARWPGGYERDGEIATLKRVLGERQSAAQLDQDPSPKEGAIFKDHMFRYYMKAPKVREFDRMLLSVDATFKRTRKGSFVVIQVWGQIGAHCYLLDQCRGRMSFSHNVAEIIAMRALWEDSRIVLVEDKANGPAIINTLEKTMSGVIPAEPHGDKESRANAVEPMWAAGQVHIPDPSLGMINRFADDPTPWVPDFVNETMKFPNAKNDDQVDAMSQALSYLRRHSMENLIKAMDNVGKPGRRRAYG